MAAVPCTVESNTEQNNVAFLARKKRPYVNNFDCSTLHSRMIARCVHICSSEKSITIVVDHSLLSSFNKRYCLY